MHNNKLYPPLERETTGSSSYIYLPEIYKSSLEGKSKVNTPHQALPPPLHIYLEGSQTKEVETKLVNQRVSTKQIAIIIDRLNFTNRAHISNFV